MLGMSVMIHIHCTCIVIFTTTRRAASDHNGELEQVVLRYPEQRHDRLTVRATVAVRVQVRVVGGAAVLQKLEHVDDEVLQALHHHRCYSATRKRTHPADDVRPTARAADVECRVVVRAVRVVRIDAVDDGREDAEENDVARTGKRQKDETAVENEDLGPRRGLGRRRFEIDGQMLVSVAAPANVNWALWAGLHGRRICSRRR